MLCFKLSHTFFCTTGSPGKSVMQQTLLEAIERVSSNVVASHSLATSSKSEINAVGATFTTSSSQRALVTTATKPCPIQIPGARRKERPAQLLLCHGDPLMSNNGTHTKLKGLFVMRNSFFLWFTRRFSTA